MSAAPPGATWRLFLGLWPADEMRSALHAHAQRWDWPASARRTPPQRLHATLHFLGNVPMTQVPALVQALAVPWTGCTLQLDTAQVWPGGIAVLEASRVPPELAQLHAQLAQALMRSGVAVETRRLRPHVTLARQAQGSRPPPDARLEWLVPSHYALLRSLPGGRGYEALQHFG